MNRTLLAFCLSFASLFPMAVTSQQANEQKPPFSAVSAYESIRHATSEEDLEQVLELIRTASGTIEYQTVDLLLDALDRQRAWLDPYNDSTFVAEVDRLGDWVESRFSSTATSIGIEKAMDAKWQLYEEILIWQEKSPGFSGLERLRQTLALQQEIAQRQEYKPEG
ncbi:hypothetical protein [Amylibacter sp. IMCC11727]|uniref:hypothetical protein n=1 Tax=Amylibacter sp. IMCC11727 TaxID=3039851 RepID=UPI00244E4CAF|nr:hypothetical protein [Amylibacter sp. IMCC11727]WGI21212.1 hypothetical protein QBD29_13995 [Amylibacter sp. IMCC11727]